MDEISERLANRFIRKNLACCDEIERYQRRLRNRILFVRNFVIAFVGMIVMLLLIYGIMQFY